MRPRPSDAGAGRSLAHPVVGRWRWGIVAAYMAAIFWSSSQTELPGIVAPFSDKLLHAVAYAGLALVVVWASVGGTWAGVTARHLLVAVATSAVYGMTDEIHQGFVPARAPDPLDLLADAVGASAAAGAVWAWGIIARGRGERDGV